MRATAALPDAIVAKAREFEADASEPAEPRDAATVLLVRPSESGDGPEVYYLLRQGSMSFAAGMAVYPGGGVDRRDFDTSVGWAGPSPAEWAERLGTDEDQARALVCAAVRETYEESGVLLAGTSSDDPTSPGSLVADTTGDDWEADRVALESRELALTDLLTRRGLVLRTDLLGVWDAWLTPVFEPRRFRTWFFVARLPEGQVTRDVSSESTSVVWLSAREAVRRAEADELALMPPTYYTSKEVGTFADPDAVLAEAQGRTAEMFMPYVEPLAGQEGRFAFAVPERLRPLAGR